MKTVYIILVHHRWAPKTNVSQEGYKTLEAAMDFIRSRSDYKGQEFTDWLVVTEEHIYEIKDIQIAE